MKAATPIGIFTTMTFTLLCILSGIAQKIAPSLYREQASTRGAAVYQFASYFGGSDVDDCDDIAVDADGYIYLACHSTSVDFPGSERKNKSPEPDMDAYVSKLDPTTGKVAYTTRLGGSKWDGAFRIAVDRYHNAFVAGFTESADFPITSDALQRKYSGGQSDAFLVKLNAEGRIEYATYFGGSNTDQCGSLAIDKDGDVYLAGTTWSDDLPGGDKGRGNKNSGSGDGFVAVWNPAHPSSLRTIYIGGKREEKVTGIVLDHSGGLFVSGFTQSADFPLKTPLQKQLKGRCDAFLVKLTASHLSYCFSTLIGGSGEDQAWGVAIDRTGKPYIAGSSNSADFPTTARALQGRYGGNTDAIVAKFDAAGTRMLYATYLGGAGEDSCGYDGQDIAVDRAGNIWVVGITYSSDFPLASSMQTVYGGGEADGFISEIAPDGQRLRMSSYVGGNGRDLLEGMALAPDESVWATGLTNSRNAHTTRLLQNNYNGGLFDAMIIKVSPLNRKAK